jgi:hypothetical protein
MPEKKQAGYQTPRFHRDDWLGYRTRRLAGLSNSCRGAFARHTCELFRDGDAGLGLNQPDKCQTEGDGPNLLN